MPRIPETAHPDLFSESPTAQSAPWDAMSEQELMDYAVLHGLRDIPPEHLTDDVVAAWESQGALLSFTEALDTAQPITADAIYENRWHLLTDEEVQSALQSAGVEVDPAQLQRLFQRARNRPRENPAPPEHRIRVDQGDGFRIDLPSGSYIQYRPLDDTNEIWWIESRRRGEAMTLMSLMLQHHPATSIAWGATSQQGQNFRKKWHAAHPEIADATEGHRVPFEGQFDPYDTVEETWENPSYPFLPLKTVERYVTMAAKRGVSEVARSSRGFLTQYRRHGRQGLDPHWARKREGFIARHMAQVSMRREELFDANGQPSRRHLALIMWAYSPTPQKL